MGTADVAQDSRFEMRHNVVLNQVKRGDDTLAIQFTRWDDLTEDQKVHIAELGKRGQTIIREQKRSVVGLGLLKPREAEHHVADALPYVFNNHHFMRSWQIEEIRPRSGNANPERTDERYCIYDELSDSYGYTEAWVQWLIRHCVTTSGFEKVTGRKPQPKD